MTRSVHCVAFVLSLIAGACGGAPAKEAEHAKIDAIFQREVSDDGVYVHLYAVKKETPPPGWKPTKDERYYDHRGSSNRGHTPRSDNVVTMAIATEEGRRYGTIEHVDDSDYVFSVAEGKKRDTARVYVPIVGPAGERLTQMFRVHPKGPSPDLVPIGKPIPRVTRWDYGHDVSDAEFVFTVPAEGEHASHFVQLIDENAARVPFPPGVVGLVPQKFIEGETFANTWSGWLARWEGAKGEGWSLSAKASMKDLDPSGPQWKSVERISKGKVLTLGGIRPDGACELTVTRIHYEVKADIPAALRHGVGPSCPELAQSLADDIAAVETKRVDAKKAAEARERADRDAQVKAYALAQKREKDREEEDAKRVQREAPILEKWREQLANNDRKSACATLQTLSPIGHAKAYAEQAATMPNVNYDDFACFMVRKDKTKDAQQIAQNAYDKRSGEDARRPVVQAPIGQGKLRDLGSAEPSAADRLKQTNDYTYGSGNASSCPYTDRSLCK